MATSNENEAVSVIETPVNNDFKDRILHAFSWSFVGYFFTQFLRLVSNIILARIFIPADFGIMQLVLVFIQGITMFSDLGIQINIVQHKNGNDASFLRTAWVVQIIRGVLIEIILIALAIPIANIYHVDILKWLIPLAGLNAIIEGLASTNLVRLNRNMELRLLTILESVSQLIGIMVMIAFAWYFRSIWTLLIAGFVSATIKTVFSHLFLSGPRMKFEFMKTDFLEIIHFGKWVFLSSMGGFLMSKMDRVILGLYISLDNLGLYGIAYALGMVVFNLLQSISYRVLTPLYSNVWRNSKSELYEQTLKVRAGLMLLTLLPLFPVIIWGEVFIHVFYPQNYWDAGWMLQVLAIACCLKCLTFTYVPLLFATGDSFRAMLLLVGNSLIFIVSLIVGGHIDGTEGIIWAIPISEVISYPILVWSIYRYGVWSPLLDFAGFIATAAVAILTGIVYGYTPDY